jgi:DNA-binding transcriptional ArsR family regulator
MGRKGERWALGTGTRTRTGTRTAVQTVPASPAPAPAPAPAGSAAAGSAAAPSAAGSAVLRSLRFRLLERLAAPASAAALARTMGESRQNVAYHLRTLEREGLVELVEERQRGNCRERIVRATARAYLVGAQALGALAGSPHALPDRLSSGYLVAVAAQAVREVAVLRQEAQAAGKPLATLTLQTDVRFATSGDRAAFAEELASAVAELAARYHRPSAASGRTFRVLVGAYPAPPPDKGHTHG